MKKLISSLFLCFALLEVHGQVNLVPNPSFEEYSQCPEFEDQIQFANGWSKFSVGMSTPDYYNSCGLSAGYGVPKSLGDYQDDNRNCGAYAGLITFATSLTNYREQIGIQLNQQLIIGQIYYISFYTVLGQSNIGGNHNGMPSNNIGIRLSTVSYGANNPAPINNLSHLNSDSIVIDSVNWTRINGSFIADSAYNYLAIGNFFNDVSTDTNNFDCASCLNRYSYYFVDDICISKDSLLCNGGIELLPCSLSVHESNFENQISIFPNPVNDILQVESEKPIEKVDFYNYFGQLIFTKENFPNDDYKLNLEQIDAGIYFVKIHTQSSEVVQKIAVN